VLAIDQGTTSSRAVIVDRTGGVVASAQREHRQICPRPGWVEHDPAEIWEAVQATVRQALAVAGARPGEVAAVGLANQRETTVFWDRRTGRPLGNAIVWQDTRSQAVCDRLAADGGENRFRELTGLPLATYFSASKIRWALDHRPKLRAALRRGVAACGTVDAWLIWNLTGGPRGGRLATDVTNASRTQLMGLESLRWETPLLDAFGVPLEMLPEIVPSLQPAGYGLTHPGGPLGAPVPVCAALGDQQAALFGQCGFAPGDAKTTYGTGCFLLMHTGRRPVHSKAGLLTTLASRRAGAPPEYALEGSVAIGGALIQWLRDNLGLLKTAAESEVLARQVEDSGGMFIVPAFSGLFAPHWRPDARGVFVGLTRYITRQHVARAALEATALQVRDVVEAMRTDSGTRLREMRVDGGMVANGLLMQVQADLLGIPVVRPAVTETTAMGAAFAAGLAAGVWADTAAVRRVWREAERWVPTRSTAWRRSLCVGWRRAVERSLGWVEGGA